MKKLKKILSMALALLLVGGGMTVEGNMKRVNATGVDLTTNIGYNVTSGSEGAITGTWSVTTGTPAAANNASANVTLNGTEYASVKTLNAKGVTLSYSLLSGYTNVKSLSLYFYAVKTQSKQTGSVVTSAYNGGTLLESKDSVNLVNNSISGAYTNIMTNLNVDANKIEATFNTSSKITDIKIAFSGTSNILLGDIHVSYDNSNVESTPCTTPVVSYNNGVVSWEKDSDSTLGYTVSEYYYTSEYVKYKDVSVLQPEEGNTVSFVPTEIPQNTNFFFKVKAKGNGESKSESSYSEYTSTAYVNTAYSDVTPSQALSLPTQSAEPYYYVHVVGAVKSFYEYNSVASIVILENGTASYVTVNNVLNYTDYSSNLHEGDAITIRCHKKTDNKMYDGTITYHNHDALASIEYSLSKISTKASLGVEYSRYLHNHVEAGWELVTSNSQLNTTDIYTIASTKDGEGYAMSNVANTNNRKTTAINVVENTFASTDSILQFKLSTNDEGYDLVTQNYGEGNKYLAVDIPAAGTDPKNYKNYLLVSDSTGDATKFTIDIANTGLATILGSEDAPKRLIRYNSSNNLFSCYSDGQNDVYLYRLTDHYQTQSFGIEQNAQQKNEVSLRFGVSIPAQLRKDVLDLGEPDTEFGMKIIIGGNTTYYPITEGVFTETEMASESVDEDLDGAVTNNHKFQFVLSINHIPSESFATEVTAAAYIRVDSTTMTAQSTTYSVNSIANDYVTKHASDAGVAPHLGMLKWLSTYVGSAN